MTDMAGSTVVRYRFPVAAAILFPTMLLYCLTVQATAAPSHGGIEGIPLVIDAHIHFGAGGSGMEPEDPDVYIEELAAECKRIKVDHVCLNGFGWPKYGSECNQLVLTAQERHPDLVVPVAFYRLGKDDPDLLAGFKAQGFRMIKMISPTAPWSDPRFDPVWAQCQSLGLPVLLHTGVISRYFEPRFAIFRDIEPRQEFTHPWTLDRVARKFPELVIIGGHFGCPWYMISSEVMRTNPNVYFDMSWITGAHLDFLREGRTDRLDDFIFWCEKALWWEGAWDRIVLGSDHTVANIKRTIDRHQLIMDRLDLPLESRRNVFGGTMATILGLDK
ncbi:amidohydrolase family protein [candidate division KSB1 bacterium]